MAIIHLAAGPVGLVQKCSRCGYVLQDYTNALSVGDWQPSWWEGNVEINGRYSYTTEAPPNCEIIQKEFDMENEAEQVLAKMQETLEALRAIKPEDRSEQARRVQITITEYEKVIAYYKVYVMGLAV